MFEAARLVCSAVKGEHAAWQAIHDIQCWLELEGKVCTICGKEFLFDQGAGALSTTEGFADGIEQSAVQYAHGQCYYEEGDTYET